MELKNRIIKSYNDFEINVFQNENLSYYIDLLDSPDENIRKKIELFHMEFLLGLDQINAYDKKSFKKYINRLNKTKGEVNFWGERFEVYFYHKLIKQNNILITNLQRGKEGFETDFIFKFNSENIGIELTTLQFNKRVIEKIDNKYIYEKIINKIIEKNNKPYANNNNALIIDITNIVYYGKLFNIDIKDYFVKEYKGFEYINKDINFGIIILVNNVLKVVENRKFTNVYNPYIGFSSENKNTNLNLKKYIRLIFNNFIVEDKTEFQYYHPNI